MHLAPIILFVYNRPELTRRTLESLANNKEATESILYIFSDGPKSDSTPDQLELVKSVREVIREKQWCGKVYILEKEENSGLAKSVLEGVSEIIKKYEKVIVLEDDLILSPFFLKYMNEGLELYQNEDRVISIHGYVYPIKEPLPETYFIRGADCWGWATWKRGWGLLETDGKKLLDLLRLKGLTKPFDFNNSYGYTKMLRKQVAGENNSWAILWYASAFLKDKLTLYPGRSLVSNIGNEGTGTHVKNTDNFSTILSDTPVEIKKIPVIHNEAATKQFERYFNSIKPNLLTLALRRLGWQ